MRSPHADEMFHRFTDRAKRALSLHAQREALRLGHDRRGPEHFLLGLDREASCCAVNVLASMGIERTAIRAAVEQRLVAQPSQQARSSLPFTPAASAVVERAIDEALGLRHHYVGTEHVLLGLIAEGRGVASEVLRDLGAELGGTRAATLAFLRGGEAFGDA